MTTQDKIIKNKLGLLRLAKELGNVTQACKIIGYSRESFYRFKELNETGGEAALQELTQKILVGMTRFERATTRPPDVYSTKLSYIPKM